MADYDFIAIGDMVTDAFIRLKDASVSCDVNRENCVICMRFKDKIPYDAMYEVPAVGNSVNASIAAARLGLRSSLVANIGDDRYGKECLEILALEGVAAKFVNVHKGLKTNYHYVLWYEDDRTILVKHENYNYGLPDIGEPKWIYLSSLGEKTDHLYDKIKKHLKTHSRMKFAFQPGTFQIKLGVKKMAYFYERADVFFCNKEESQRILKIDSDNIKVLLREIKKLGPRIVLITDGKDGAYMKNENGDWFMPPYPDPKPPLERTGAGDAFSSTFTAALALGLSNAEALRWAPVNSMSVIQYVGAREGLLTREKLEEFLKNAPEDYKPNKI